MPQVVIENPIINSPFEEPKRHFRFSEEGITSEIVEGRRVSSYFVPIPKPKAREKSQLVFDTEWTQEHRGKQAGFAVVVEKGTQPRVAVLLVNPIFVL